MTNMSPHKPTPLTVMIGWLSRRLGDAMAEVTGDLARLAAQPARGLLFRSFDQMPRRIGKADLCPTADERAEARAAAADWNPDRWSLDQVARLCVVLTAAAARAPDAFHDDLGVLFATSDMAGLVALHQGLALLPDPSRLVAQARAGARSGMVPVFEAIAHRNPYPVRFFDEDGWNQMILKAVFLDRRLDPVIGLDSRANRQLAGMLGDYVRERWAAKRTVPWDLWRCVGVCADDNLLALIDRLLATGSEHERRAGTLALADCPLPEADRRLAGLGEDADAVRAGRLTWKTLGNSIETEP
jgi:hypothetical protein